MTAFFHKIISIPLYNGLILLIHTLPFFDAGIIIIIFTIIVKLILLPLSIKASKSQMKMKNADADLKVIKERYKDNTEELNKKTIEYYKEKGINPFSSILILIVQIPILLGLYRIFIHSGLPAINSSMLYTFMQPLAPQSINMVFLGLINISEKSLVLALLAGASTYLQVSLATASTPAADGQSDMAKAMSTNMKYVFPVIMTLVGYSISAAVALYLITSNVFAIAQEYYIKKKYHKAVFVE